MKVLSVSSVQEVAAAVLSCTGRVVVYFGGAKDASGKSWCPDCVSGSCFCHDSNVIAFPAVNANAQEYLGADDMFIDCSVGGRPE